MWIKLDGLLRQISDKEWEAYVGNTLIKAKYENPDKSKIIKSIGYTWYLDDKKV